MRICFVAALVSILSPGCGLLFDQGLPVEIAYNIEAAIRRPLFLSESSVVAAASCDQAALQADGVYFGEDSELEDPVFLSDFALDVEVPYQKWSVLVASPTIETACDADVIASTVPLIDQRYFVAEVEPGTYCVLPSIQESSLPGFSREEWCVGDRVGPTTEWDEAIESL